MAVGHSYVRCGRVNRNGVPNGFCLSLGTGPGSKVRTCRRPNPLQQTSCTRHANSIYLDLIILIMDDKGKIFLPVFEYLNR